MRRSQRGVCRSILEGVRRHGLLGILAPLLGAPAGAGAAAVVGRVDAAAGFVAPACSVCRDGDLLVRAGALTLALGATPRPLRSFYGHETGDALGSILSFSVSSVAAPAEARRNDLAIGSPYVRREGRSAFLAYTSIDAQSEPGGAEGLTFVARGAHRFPDGSSAKVVTVYRLQPASGVIEIHSTLTNDGPGALRDLRYALYMDAGQIYEFSPFEREHHPALRYRVIPKPGYYLAWIDANPRVPGEPSFVWDGAAVIEEAAPVHLEPGESHRVHYTLLAASRPSDLMRALLERVGAPGYPARVAFDAHGSGPFEVVVRDAASRAVFFRSFLHDAEALDLWLPAGRYVARAHFFPSIDEAPLGVGPDATARAVLRQPSSGRVHIRLRDASGADVPGKVTFIGVDPTRTPYFRPHDPVRSGRYWESFKNSHFPEVGGSEVELPVGRYVAYGSRGPAYSLDQREIEVRTDRALDLDLTIDRVVDTHGLVGVDPHLHTLESDGAVRVAERVRSLVAEGVEVAVATDHNRLTDYGPAVRALGFERELATLIGAEVTVPDLMDFNTYPVVPRPDAPDGGALDPRFENAGAAFDAARARDSEVVVQVNHPRGWRYDFLNVYALEPRAAASALPGFTTAFDVLEAVNGARLDSEGNASALRDWMNLLNRGIYRPLVGSSDAHEIDGDEPGYSRTWVYLDRDPGEPFDERALAEAIRRGRSFVSNGPIAHLILDGAARPGDLHRARQARVRAAVRIQSAPWIAVDEVELIVNGEPREAWPVPAGERRGVEWRREAELTLEGDAWIVAVVRGRRSLYPVVQRGAREGGPDRAPLPFAVTNPIFVDVDGDGRFGAPLPASVAIGAEGG